ncbi:MAG: hypothetical protein ACYCWW_09525 [Deltaproteobacteria bacterium]
MIRQLSTFAFGLSLALALGCPQSKGGGGTTGSHGSSAGGSSTSGGSSGGGSSGGSTSGGGTSGGTGGSTSGGTTGAAACSTSADAGTEINPCATNADCLCPLLCTGDGQGDAGNVCLYPCKRSADCQNPGESCDGRFCQFDPCGLGAAADGGSANGNFYGPCNSSDAGDGTCVPTSFGGFGTFGSCLANGSATGSCDPTLSSRDAGLLCIAGDSCVALPSDAGSSGRCFGLCDPTATSATCPAGAGCGSAGGGAAAPGNCYAELDGGCLGSPATPFEYAACGPNSRCGCPLTCAADPVTGPSADFSTDLYCLSRCATTADCADLNTVCRGGLCVIDYCLSTPTANGADAGVGGTLNGACASLDAGDGTCLGESNPNTGSDLPYGLCQGSGTSTTSCDPAATRQSPATACAQGYYCNQNPNSGASSCALLCDPTIDGGTCAAGTTCQVYFSSKSGLCLPPSNGGA